jgi:hypothetical protein
MKFAIAKGDIFPAVATAMRRDGFDVSEAKCVEYIGSETLEFMLVIEVLQ